MSPTVGYWEPHTASIDFCEENYAYSIYIAEPLNTVSALPIALAGVWSLWLTPPSLRWPRFILCWVAFMIVGIGSMALHATLRRPGQALDEIPMVLANLCFAFCLKLPDEADAPRLIAMLLVIGTALVTVYLVYEVYVVFFLSYAIVVAYLTIQSARQAFNAKGLNAPLLRRLWYTGMGQYFTGFATWVLDNLGCDLVGGLYLHVLWHILAGMGTLTFVLLLMAFTADKAETPFVLKRKLRFFPYLQLLEYKCVSKSE